MFQRAVKHMPCVLAIDEIQCLAWKYRYQPNPDANMLPMLARLLKASEKLPILFVGLTQEVTPELQWFVRPDKNVIYLKLPNEQQRESLFRFYIERKNKSSHVVCDPTINTHKLARKTDGFSQRCIKDIVQTTIPATMMESVRNDTYNRQQVYVLTMQDLMKTIEDIKDAPYKLAGTKRPRSWTEFLF